MSAGRHRRQRRSSPREFQPRLELLEHRELLAVNVFVVESVEDDLLSQTLRWAIDQANGTANDVAGPDEIRFNIAGSGVHAISIFNSLPAVTDPVKILGYTQAGASENTADVDEASNAAIMIEILWAGSGAGVDGLVIDANDSVVSGLAIGDFSGYGIRISGDGNLVAGNHVGANAAGTTDRGNLAGGVLIDEGSGNVVGWADGATSAEALAARNVIAGNGGPGVRIVGSGEDEQVAVRTIYDDGSEDNDEPVVTLANTATDNVVRGNVIGLDATGATILANGGDGVFLDHAARNTIGGASELARNLISGNGGAGVRIQGSGGTVVDNETFSDLDPENAGDVVLVSTETITNAAIGNVVAGNYVGLDRTGLAAGFGNTSHGVSLASASFTTIGGASAGERNVVAENGGHGVSIVAEGRNNARNNTVSANYVGVNAAGGGVGFGNGGSGVYLAGGAFQNVVGGDSDDARNVISGNGEQGVHVKGTSSLHERTTLPGTTTTLDRDVLTSSNDGSGRLKLTLDGGHGLRKGVRINLFGHSNAGYNYDESAGGPVLTVVDVSGDDVVTDAPFATGGTGGTWTLFQEYQTLHPIQKPGEGYFGAAWLSDLYDEVDGKIRFSLEIPTYALAANGDVTLTTISSSVDVERDEDSLESEAMRQMLRTRMNIVSGNYVGTDASGEADLGNADNGVLVSDGAEFTVVGAYILADPDGGDGGEGSQVVAKGNLVSGNGDDGVEVRGVGSYTWLARNIFQEIHEGMFRILDPDTVLTIVAGNFVGTDKDGEEAIANEGDGLHATNAARGALVGVPAANTATDLDEDELRPARNVFSGNLGDGVRLDGDFLTLFEVGGNFIGTDKDGETDLGNAGSGVVMEDGATASFIGADDGVGPALVLGASGFRMGPSQASNLIAGNDKHGVVLRNTGRPLQFLDENASGSDNPAVFGNLIGVNYQGEVISNGAASDPDSGDGVLIENSSRVTVGVGVLQTINVISGNLRHGIHVTGAESTLNVVAQNLVGGDPRSLPTELGGENDLEAVPLGNGGAGILVAGGAHDNRFFDVKDRSRFRQVAVLAFKAGLTSFTNHEVLKSQYDDVLLFGEGPIVVVDENGDPILNPYDLDLDDRLDEVEKSELFASDLTVRVLRNYVQANAGGGIVVDGVGTDRNLFSSSFVGTDGSGTSSFDENGARLFGNQQRGVEIRDGASDNVVGYNPLRQLRLVAVVTTNEDLSDRPPIAVDFTRDQTLDLTHNVVSGNAAGGVYVHGEGTSGTIVGGNAIGSNREGTAALGNFGPGVEVADGAENTVVGVDFRDEDPVFQRINLVAGNAGPGILLRDVHADLGIETGHVVAFNYVGMSADETALPNLGDGVRLENVSGALVLRNTIVGNGAPEDTEADGIHVTNGSDLNLLAANFIGITENDVAIGNAGYGVRIDGGSTGTLVGVFNDDSSLRNVVSNNAQGGVAVLGGGVLGATNFAVIAGNYIGTSVDGTSAQGNGGAGVLVDGATTVAIGTNLDEGEAVQGNLIAFNAGPGVHVRNVSAAEPTIGVAGNTIDQNDGAGVLVEDSSHVWVGGVVPVSRNQITRNGEDGVRIEGEDSHDVKVVNNWIGTDDEGADLGNAGDGVRIDGASDNQVGGVTPGWGNVIAFNDGAGVSIQNAARDAVFSNLFHDNGLLGIDLGDDGRTTNDVGDGDSGANNLQNFPVLVFNRFDGGRLYVDVTVDSPSSGYPIVVEFYLADSSTGGEGKVFLLAVNYSGGTVTVDLGAISSGAYVVATATDKDDNTSEFSDVLSV